MSLLAVKKKLLMGQKKGLDVSEVFNTSLWTGNGTARTITTGINSGEGSLVWIKDRMFARDNILVDTARTNGILVSNKVDAQFINGNFVSSFNSSGFSLGTANEVNGYDETYVGWQFRRAPKFFDIVQYTGNGVVGRQIAHDLGVKPGIIIIKRTSSGSFGWGVYHHSQGIGKVGILNSPNAFFFDNNFWAAEPTDTTMVLGNSLIVNADGHQYIAYLFAHDPSPEGLIQCGSYVGNGSATGPVVNLGWRPQYLLWKSATSSEHWWVKDALRGDTQLRPNLANAEDSGAYVSFNANGFQPIINNGLVNGAGQTYIYMAIREAA